ncbi:hypothetical protein KC19_9G067900 [Ceratodon purpureus]|nr:hypothetical protein KC19_9G067900 [Ceratodon purpureus]
MFFMVGAAGIVGVAAVDCWEVYYGLWRIAMAGLLNWTSLAVESWLHVYRVWQGLFLAVPHFLKTLEALALADCNGRYVEVDMITGSGELVACVSCMARAFPCRTSLSEDFRSVGVGGLQWQ